MSNFSIVSSMKVMVIVFLSLPGCKSTDKVENAQLTSSAQLFEKYDDVKSLEENLFGFYKYFFSKNKECKV
ncbi:MAG: hypothetical protein NTV34_10380, partial [Proteobacteria bacterium]|nr:hypothetical protein [Pseudomonadota bacterium]